MSRRRFTIPCEGSAMGATLDGRLEGAKAALLIVSGGNEIRSGTWEGQAWLAAEVARAGFPVLRFDRRGVGDSEGANLTYRGSGPDIAAALGWLRAQAPQARIVALGNCDAASALMLGDGCGADGVILSNPWTFEGEEEGASAEAQADAKVSSLRAHYRARLANPAALLRLLTGKVSLRGLVGSLLALAKPRAASAPDNLAARMMAGLGRFSGPVSILIAGQDRTAQAFVAGWHAKDQRLARCEGASHSFVEADARLWLLQQVIKSLDGI
ncbi:hydrolase 1, exosortase A system-associated [Novosphingobium rosa]|uniref:hydrolase 1, exosortase A system-associated n=1 Tax=Novosphingobium rosa TaxID=76978 RepID=UPI0008344E25|nr:hydrolase 1, exosortase A system-associated [Novosphingobium rosa]